MKEEYISMKEAAEQLGVKRPSLYHYVEVLKLETHRFQLDRETYLSQGDFEKIQVLRDEKEHRKARLKKSDSAA